MKKTVVFLDQQSWLGGAQRVLEATLESVASEYDSIVAFPDQGPFRSALEAKKIETMDLPVGSYRAGRKSTLEMVVFAGRSLYCSLKLAVLIHKRNIALVYINGPRCLPTGVLAAWLTRRPAIFHLHLFFTRKLEITLVARLARHVSRIIACCHAAAAALQDVDPGLSSKIHVLHNPAPQRGNRRVLHFRTPARPISDRFTIAIIGRITERKGHRLLIDALGRLSPDVRSKIQLLVVGAEAPGCGPDLEYARSLRIEAIRQGLEGQITWAGYIADPESCYGLIDLLVHPALPPEALSIVILEALDRGIPVVASRTGGIPEIIQDGVNGLLFSPGDVAALHRALERFFLDRELRERLVHGASKGIDRRFSAETFSCGVRALMSQICPLHSSMRP